LKNYRLNHVVVQQFGIGLKEQFTIRLAMGFLRRFFSKQDERPNVEERERVEERMQSTLKEQYQHDI